MKWLNVEPDPYTDDFLIIMLVNRFFFQTDDYVTFSRLFLTNANQRRNYEITDIQLYKLYTGSIETIKLVVDLKVQKKKATTLCKIDVTTSAGSHGMFLFLIYCSFSFLHTCALPSWYLIRAGLVRCGILRPFSCYRLCQCQC